MNHVQILILLVIFDGGEGFNLNITKGDQENGSVSNTYFHPYLPSLYKRPLFKVYLDPTATSRNSQVKQKSNLQADVVLTVHCVCHKHEKPNNNHSFKSPIFRRTWSMQCIVFVSVDPSWFQPCRSTPSSTGGYILHEHFHMRIVIFRMSFFK